MKKQSVKRKIWSRLISTNRIKQLGAQRNKRAKELKPMKNNKEIVLQTYPLAVCVQGKFSKNSGGIPAFAINMDSRMFIPKGFLPHPIFTSEELAWENAANWITTP